MGARSSSDCHEKLIEPEWLAEKFQAQPLHRSQYADDRLNDFSVRVGVAELQSDDWAAYGRTAIHPGNAAARKLGHDAAEVRRRRRAETDA